MIVDYCPTRIKADLHFIDWVEYIWKHNNIEKKIYHVPLEKYMLVSGPYGLTWKTQTLKILMLNRFILFVCLLNYSVIWRNVLLSLKCFVRIGLKEIRWILRRKSGAFELETTSRRLDENQCRCFQQILYKIYFYRIWYERQPSKIIVAKGKQVGDCPILVIKCSGWKSGSAWSSLNRRTFRGLYFKVILNWLWTLSVEKFVFLRIL